MIADSGVSRGWDGGVSDCVCIIGLLHAFKNRSKISCAATVKKSFKHLSMTGKGYHIPAGDQEDEELPVKTNLPW